MFLNKVLVSLCFNLSQTKRSLRMAAVELDTLSFYCELLTFMEENVLEITIKTNCARRVNFSSCRGDEDG